MSLHALYLSIFSIQIERVCSIKTSGVSHFLSCVRRLSQLSMSKVSCRFLACNGLSYIAVTIETILVKLCIADSETEELDECIHRCLRPRLVRKICKRI